VTTLIKPETAEAVTTKSQTRVEIKLAKGRLMLTCGCEKPFCVMQSPYPAPILWGDFPVSILVFHLLRFQHGICIAGRFKQWLPQVEIRFISIHLDGRLASTP